MQQVPFHDAAPRAPENRAKDNERVVESKNELYVSGTLVALQVELASALTGEDASSPTAGR
jgi:hypothetical protein